jgi:hypothetical protein
MPIELTEQQRSFMEQHPGEPVEFVDPQTNRIYVLVARQDCAPAVREEDSMSDEEWLDAHVPPGIRRSQKAFRRDLPELLKNKKLHGQWAAYRGDERVGIAKNGIKLTNTCFDRGFASTEFWVGWISPCELIEVKELDPQPWHNGRD